VDGQRHDPAGFTPEKGPVTHGTGGWAGARDGLDGYELYYQHRDSIPDRPALRESLYRLSYPIRHTNANIKVKVVPSPPYRHKTKWWYTFALDGCE
jgi:hypothetical protein